MSRKTSGSQQTPVAVSQLYVFIALRLLFYCLLLLSGFYAFSLLLSTPPSTHNHPLYHPNSTLSPPLTHHPSSASDDPEHHGFLPQQVRPFSLLTADNVSLHAWHIIPPAFYRSLIDGYDTCMPGPQDKDSYISRHGILRADPDALLVLYFHGGGGDVASGWRPESYRAISAMDALNTHVFAVDYRGFGKSTRSKVAAPSEEGLLADARALLKFAMEEAQIPPERIVLFGHSLGAGVAVSLAHELAHRKVEPVLFAGMVLVAPFVDEESLLGTEDRVVSKIPLLGPLWDYLPSALGGWNTFRGEKWPTMKKLTALVRTYEKMYWRKPKYNIRILHGENDGVVPSSHSRRILESMVKATWAPDTASRYWGDVKDPSDWDTKEGQRTYERQSFRGIIRFDLLNHGPNDRIISYSAVSMAVHRAFQSARSPVPPPPPPSFPSSGPLKIAAGPSWW